jgi:membrane-bound lytic murein transglycosylase F
MPELALDQGVVVARDLEAIRASGTLRILVPEAVSLAEMNPMELELLTGFAASENVHYEWVSVDRADSLYQRFAAGEGDMIALLGKGQSSQPPPDITHTLPWGVSVQQLIGRAGGNGSNAKNLEDLVVRQIALKQSSAAWPVLSDLSHKHPGMELQIIPENTDMMTVLNRVKSGYYDLAVAESLALPEDLQFHHQLEIVMSLTQDVFMSWGVRNEATALYQALNNFLHKRHLELEVGRNYREDFPSIKQRRQLRLITYQSPVNYFYERGRFKGFEYEFVKKFAEKHGLRLDVVVANSHEQMREMLQAGKGDIIAASVPENLFFEDPDLSVTRPYNYATPVLISRTDETLVDFRDLEGRTVVIASQSPYLQVLQGIRAQGINFSILIPDSNLNSETLLFRISRGMYDLTVIGSHEMNAELSRQLNLKAQFNLSDPQALTWAVRNNSTLLLSELDNFIELEYRKGFYNVIYSRYIDKPRVISPNSRLFTQLDQLSPYDEIIHKYADLYSFDWRLIVAQIYQESRFNPAAVSVAGATGLMQLLPDTAAIVGITEINDPDRNIYGGIRYMDSMRSLFEDELAPEDRTWFTLAAYNAGYNRVKSARELAEKMNLDKNKWFDNVEIAMQRLARPYVREGEVMRNCRCGQTVVYVREIKTLYKNYLRLTESVRSAATQERQPQNI